MLSMAIVLILCAALFPFAVRRPQNGVLILAALLPFHGLNLISPLPINFWKEAVVLTVLVACFFARRQPGRRVAVVPWMWPLALFAIMGTVSALIVYRAAAVFPIKIALFYVLLAITIIWFPFERRDKDRLITVLLATGAISAAYGIVQQIIGGEGLAAMGYPWNDVIRSAGPLLRSFGTFVQPFPFGLYLMIVLLMCGAAALAEPNRKRSIVFWAVSPLLLVGMISSVVRASYLGLIIGAVIIGLFLFRKFLKILLFSVVALLVVSTPIALVMGASSGIQSMFSAESFEQRTEHWTRTIPFIMTQPFGQGLGTTGASVQRVEKLPTGLHVMYQPDNYYVKILLELGPMGFAAFVAVLVVALMVLRRLVQHETDQLERAFAGGAQGVVAAACVAATVSTYWEIFPMDAYFWLILAAAGSVTPDVAARIRGKAQGAPMPQPVAPYTLPSK